MAKRMNLDDEIPTYEYWRFMKPNGTNEIVVFDWEHDKVPTWRELLRRVKCYPFTHKYRHKTAIIIGESGLNGKVYILNNYERGGLYEYGTTEGFA